MRGDQSAYIVIVPCNGGLSQEAQNLSLNKDEDTPLPVR